VQVLDAEKHIKLNSNLRTRRVGTKALLTTSA
jgi:hypothetical protein